MGIFANAPDPNMPQWVSGKPPKQKWAGQSEFEAMGVEVPFFRRQAGYENCKQMGMKDSKTIFELIQDVSQMIERDDPHGALERMSKNLDVTGCYRLLAVLLCTPKPEAS